MHLIMLLSVTLCSPFGSCYLFAVETPRGKQRADKRLLFCKQPSDLLELGLAPSQLVSFVLAPSANLRVTDSPEGGLMALLYALQCAGWSLSGCQSLREGVRWEEEEEETYSDIQRR